MCPTVKYTNYTDYAEYIYGGICLGQIFPPEPQKLPVNMSHWTIGPLVHCSIAPLVPCIVGKKQKPRNPVPAFFSGKTRKNTQNLEKILRRWDIFEKNQNILTKYIGKILVRPKNPEKQLKLGKILRNSGKILLGRIRKIR